MVVVLCSCKFPEPDEVEPDRLGGVVDGLWLPNLIELQLQAGAVNERLLVTANGGFHFGSELRVGDSYAITMTAPMWQDCDLSGAQGVVASGDSMSVSIRCEPPISVDVKISAPFQWTFDPVALKQRIEGSILVQQVVMTVLAPEATSISVYGAMFTSGTAAASIALSDGDTAIPVVISAHGMTGEYEVTWSRGSTEIEQLTYAKPLQMPSAASMGTSVAYDGERMALGSPFDDSAGLDHGAVYIYRRNGGSWAHEATVTAWTVGPNPSSSMFGSSVALSGDVLVVGAPGDSTTTPHSGAAYVFIRDVAGWREAHFFKEPVPTSNGSSFNNFATSVATDGDTVVVGTILSGYAYVYRRSGDFQFQTRLRPTSYDAANDRFGSSRVRVMGSSA
jgi:hypothetical protein